MVSEKRVLISAVLMRSVRKTPRAILEKKMRGHEHEREDGEADQGKAPVDADHHPRDADEQKGVPEDENDDRGKELVHVLNVVGGAGHQAGHGRPVEERQGQPLNVPEKPHSQIVHDALAGHLHHDHLKEIQKEFDEGEDQKRNGRKTHAGDVLLPQEYGSRPRTDAGFGEKDLRRCPVHLKPLGISAARPRRPRARRYRRRGDDPARPLRQRRRRTSDSGAGVAGTIWRSTAILVTYGIPRLVRVMSSARNAARRIARRWGRTKG